MKKFDVVLALSRVREAHALWTNARIEFLAGSSTVMSRLIHEAARNYMSAEEVAKASGFTVKRVRQMMRDAGLNPKTGKSLLSKQAAEALDNNAALMGIEPHEMDLTSPLAYLPMGSVMKRELQDQAVSKVTEVSGNTYAESQPKIAMSIRLGLMAEESNPYLVAVPDLTNSQIEWLASWLAGDGVTKP